MCQSHVVVNEYKKTNVLEVEPPMEVQPHKIENGLDCLPACRRASLSARNDEKILLRSLLR